MWEHRGTVYSVDYPHLTDAEARDVVRGLLARPSAQPSDVTRYLAQWRDELMWDVEL